MSRSCVLASQTRVTPVKDPVTKRDPSGLNAIVPRVLSSVESVSVHFHEEASQNTTSGYSDRTATIWFPSGLNTAAVAGESGYLPPVSFLGGPSFLHSHSCTVVSSAEVLVSPEAIRIRSPCGLKTTEFTTSRIANRATVVREERLHTLTLLSREPDTR